MVYLIRKIISYYLVYHFNYTFTLSLSYWAILGKVANWTETMEYFHNGLFFIMDLVFCL